MDFQAVTEFLDLIPKYGAPGVDCVVQQGYEVLYRHQAGYSDREARIPMNGRERFFLYSLSKPLTITAAMQLVEQGRLLLTQPLSDFYPAFASVSVRQGDALVPLQTPITIEHLMTMSAGLDYVLDSPAIRAGQEATDGRFPTQCLPQALAQQPLLFQPGSHWNYSLCHDLLGAVVELVSGQTLGQYLHDHVLAPLNMTHTGFSREGQPLMAQYRFEPLTGNVRRIPPDNEYILGRDYESGGAGLLSTTEDYSRFAAMLANGGVSADGVRILQPETIEAMRTNRLSPVQKADYNWEQGRGYGYGLGVRTMMTPEQVPTPASVGEFGWAGAAGTYLLVDPAKKLSVFYAQQMRTSLEPFLHPRLRDLVYHAVTA